MLDEYPNLLDSEKIVEICFAIEKLNEVAEEDRMLSVLDVGGVPSWFCEQYPLYKAINNMPNVEYMIADFRPGIISDNMGIQMNLPVTYHGNFNKLEIDRKFDVVMFISSIEHFMQSPNRDEGDNLEYVEGDSILAFEKALDLLDVGGKIILTVPYGFPKFANTYQTYDMDLIQDLTEGTKILDSCNYADIGGEGIWRAGDAWKYRYLEPFGVGCYYLEKVDG